MVMPLLPFSKLIPSPSTPFVILYGQVLEELTLLQPLSNSHNSGAVVSTSASLGAGSNSSTNDPSTVIYQRSEMVLSRAAEVAGPAYSPSKRHLATPSEPFASQSSIKVCPSLCYFFALSLPCLPRSVERGSLLVH